MFFFRVTVDGGSESRYQIHIGIQLLARGKYCKQQIKKKRPSLMTTVLLSSVRRMPYGIARKLLGWDVFK